MAHDSKKNDQNSKPTTWEPFPSREKLQEFLNSDNTDDALYQGIYRIRKQLTDGIKKISAGDVSADNRLSAIYDYLMSSSECRELFKIWDTQIANDMTKLETSILELFAKLIQYTSIVSSLRSTGTILIRNILKNYMRTLIRNLSCTRLPTVQATLKLLLAMNSHEIAITRELYAEFPFGSNSLIRLLNIRKNDKAAYHYDVRTLYIRFVLSFFVHGDAQIKSNVLENKNFANLIFKGLIKDPYEMVDEVLTKIYDYVISDDKINRVTKISFFSHTVLNQILQLYSRCNSEPPESKNVVANVAHRFLLSICCNPGTGICFHDSGWYPANVSSTSSHNAEKSTNYRKDRVHNVILSSFIKILNPAEDLRQRELLLKILEACPELIQVYWQNAKNLFGSPFLSYRWLANISLLQKIIFLPVPKFYNPEGTNICPKIPPKVNTIMENILPRVFDRSTLSKCLVNSSPLVNYNTMITLCISFQKLDKVLQTFSKVIDNLDVFKSDTDDVAPSSLWRKTVENVLEEMKRRVPDIQIFLRHLSLTLSGKQKFSSSIMTDGVDGEQIRNNIFQETVLKLLKYYHRYLPEAIMETKFDIGNFIPANLGQIHVGTQLNLLELLNIIPDFNFSTKSENNHLVTFLSLYICTPYSQIRSCTENVLENLLSKSITFQHDPHELFIWLESLPQVFPEDNSVQDLNDHFSVIRFLGESIETFLKNPFPYIDELNQVVLCGVSKDNNNDDTMESVEMENEQGVDALLEERLKKTYLSNSYPFSPLLVTMMKKYRENKNNLNIMSFINVLFRNLLYKQPTPRYLNTYVGCLRDCINADVSKDVYRKGRWDIADYVINIDIFFQQYATLKRSCVSLEPTEYDNREESMVKNVLKDINPISVNTARVKFLELMSNIPVSIINRYFLDLANYCKSVLGWVRFEPFKQYLNCRLPGCGSLFDFQDISLILKEIDVERSTTSVDTKKSSVKEKSYRKILVESLFDTFSFSDLFANALFHMDNPLIESILRKSLSSCPPRQLPLASRHIMLCINCIFDNFLDANLSALRLCFDLLKELVIKVITDSSEETALISDYVVELVFRWPLLKELFLLKTEKSWSADKMVFSLLDCLDQLFYKNKIADESWRKRSSTAIKYLVMFKDILLNKIYNIIKGVETGVIPLGVLSENIGTTLSKFVSLLEVSELSQILMLILNIGILDVSFLSEEVTVNQYKVLLSHVLSAISHNNLRNIIDDNVVKKLIYIWGIYSSREMDNLLLQIVMVCIPPGLIEPIDTMDFKKMHPYLPPTWAKNFDKSLVQDLVDNMNDTRSRILGILLTINSDIRLEFVSKILSTPNLLDPLSISEILSLLTAFFKVVATNSDLQFTWSSIATYDDKRAVFSLSEKYGCQLFQQTSSQTLRAIPSGFSVATCAFLSLSPSSQLISTLERLITNGSSIVFGVDSLSVIECYLERNHGDLDELNLKEFLSNIFHQATLFMENEVFKTCEHDTLVALFNRINNLIRFIPRNRNLDANIIGEFIFVLLEKKFEESIVLKCVASLISSEYNKEHLLGPPLDRVVEAIINNSQFKILAGIPDISKRATESPTFLIRLMICSLLNLIFRTSPAVCCKSSFLSSLLSCYGASTSLADQLLLDIFILYEKSSGSSVGPYAMIWGPGSIRSMDRRGLMDQKIVVESLGLIDPMKMMISYTHFPIDKTLEVKALASEVLSSQCDQQRLYSFESERAPPVYDPSFFLPNFASLFSYGNLLDCRKLIEVNALGFILVSLSSTVEDVRRAGYYLMDEFYILLENANFREKKQILLLLNSLKNSIIGRDDGKPLQRLPTIFTVFFAHALNIFTNPAHFMYPLINKFLLQRPLIDLEDIPMFYSLFHSSSDNYQKERVWILRLLSAGLKTAEDYRMYMRRHVWDMISSHYCSSLADSVSCKLVIEILFNFASVPRVITDITRNRGLLSWLWHLCLTSQPSMSASNSTLLGPRILLRVLRGCKNSALHAVIKEATLIASGLLKTFVPRSEKKESLVWSLNYLDSVLRIFHYLTLISPTPERIFTTYHASCILTSLEQCELLNPNIFTVYSPSSSILYINHNRPSLSDSLDELSILDHDIVKVYRQIIRMLFELVVSGDIYDLGMVDKVISRTLSLGVSSEAKQWAIECLSASLSDR
ncbi:9449_t:CDS:10 [Acaulospora morrowiae]|uniref:9449_t:CDS:1 n=1 Tax=Acaulospora morrowiae TaxID=94023 RepID=A0A9N8V986_9GLOM|nr:9449_t:CDS:10 [Acaulospora morrowiae]